MLCFRGLGAYVTRENFENMMQFCAFWCIYLIRLCLEKFLTNEHILDKKIIIIATRLSLVIYVGGRYEHQTSNLLQYRGVPRIWEGGAKNFFFRFGNLHVAKRHAAHGEAMRIARGVRGHAPPRKFFKTMQFGAF